MNIAQLQSQFEPKKQKLHVQWFILISCFLTSLVSQLLLPGAIRGLHSSEASFLFEVLPTAEHLTKTKLEDEHRLHNRDRHFNSSIGFLTTEIALCTSYLLLLWMCSGELTKLQARFIEPAGAILVALPILSTVMLSTDTIAYGSHGRAVAFHGAAPGISPSPLAKDDPFIVALSGKYYPSPYGPAWTLISSKVAELSGESIGKAVFLFRLIAVSSVFAGAFAIWQSLKIRTPEHALLGVSMFLWNPLVSFETGNGGHNDAVMIAMLAIGFWMRQLKRPILMMMAITIAVLVKYSTVVLIPLLLIDQFRDTRSPWLALKLSLRCVLGLALPSIVVLGLLSRQLNTSRGESPISVVISIAAGQEFTNSWHELAYNRLRIYLGDPVELIYPDPDFSGWWVTTHEGVGLHRLTSDQSESALAQSGSALLVVAVSDHDSLLVRGRNGALGFVKGDEVDVCDRPDWADQEPQFATWEWSPGTTENARFSSLIVRRLTTGFFLCLCVFAAFRVYQGASVELYSTVLLLGVCFFMGGWFWPWYTLWPLTMAAFVPKSRAAVISVALCLSSLTLYMTIGASPEVEEMRSIPVIGISALAYVGTRIFRGHP